MHRNWCDGISFISYRNIFSKIFSVWSHGRGSDLLVGGAACPLLFLPAVACLVLQAQLQRGEVISTGVSIC